MHPIYTNYRADFVETARGCVSSAFSPTASAKLGSECAVPAWARPPRTAVGRNCPRFDCGFRVGAALVAARPPRICAASGETACQTARVSPSRPHSHASRWRAGTSPAPTPGPVRPSVSVGAALVAARLAGAWDGNERGGRVWAPAPTAQGAPHLRGPRANPAKRFAWGKGGPAAGMSVRARPEASDPKLGLTLSRCGGCATPHCLPLREKHLAPAAQLLFRLRGSLCGCSARLRASCHAAGWAHDRVAKRPFREKCRWASPSLFFRLHVLLAPLCAYPPRFLRSGAWR